MESNFPINKQFFINTNLNFKDSNNSKQYVFIIFIIFTFLINTNLNFEVANNVKRYVFTTIIIIINIIFLTYIFIKQFLPFVFVQLEYLNCTYILM